MIIKDLTLYFVGLVLGRIQRYGLLHRQQPIQGIEGVGMGQRRATDIADLLTAIGVGVVQIIVLADDGGRQGAIDDLREGVVGEVGIAAIHAVRQPFLFQAAAGVVPVALGQPPNSPCHSSAPRCRRGGRWRRTDSWSGCPWRRRLG